MQEKTLFLNRELKQQAVEFLEQKGYKFLEVDVVGCDVYQHPDDQEFKVAISFDDMYKHGLSKLGTTLGARAQAVSERRAEESAIMQLAAHLGIDDPEVMYIDTSNDESYIAASEWLKGKGFKSWVCGNQYREFSFFVKGRLIVCRTSVDDGRQETLEGAKVLYGIYEATGVTKPLARTQHLPIWARVPVGVLSVIAHLLVGLAFIIPVALTYTAAKDLNAKNIADAMAWVGKLHEKWGEWNEKILTI